VQTIQDATLPSEVKKDYEAMAAKARTDGTHNLTPFGIPGTAVGLFIPGRGYITASSIRAGGARQSPQTCNIIGGANHQYFGNYRERNAFVIALNLGWIYWGTNNQLLFPRESAITAYGIKNKNTGEVGAMNPCSRKDDFLDCADLLPQATNLRLVVRGGEEEDRVLEIAEGLRAISFKA